MSEKENTEMSSALPKAVADAVRSLSVSSKSREGPLNSSIEDSPDRLVMLRLGRQGDTLRADQIGTSFMLFLGAIRQAVREEIQAVGNGSKESALLYCGGAGSSAPRQPRAS